MPRRRQPPPDANDYIAGGNVFKEGGHPLHAFVGVKRISVNCHRVEGRQLHDHEALHTHWTPDNPKWYREHLTPCPNATCHGGGFRTHDIVQEMISKREQSREVDTIVCAGNEKLGRDFRSCLRIAGPVVIEIEYEDPPKDDET